MCSNFLARICGYFFANVWTPMSFLRFTLNFFLLSSRTMMNRNYVAPRYYNAEYGYDPKNKVQYLSPEQVLAYIRRSTVQNQQKNKDKPKKEKWCFASCIPVGFPYPPPSREKPTFPHHRSCLPSLHKLVFVFLDLCERNQSFLFLVIWWSAFSLFHVYSAFCPTKYLATARIWGFWVSRFCSLNNVRFC